MSDKVSVKQANEECSSEGKAQYLQTAGGNITCLRCTAQSTRTKQQCCRPAIKTSRTQKCLTHEGRVHAQESLQRIAKASTVQGQATKNGKLEGQTAGFISAKWNGPRTAEGKQRIAQAQLKHGAYSKASLKAKQAESIQLRQLEDIARLVGMIQGPRTRGAKPRGYVPVTSIKAIKKLIALE